MGRIGKRTDVKGVKKRVLDEGVRQRLGREASRNVGEIVKAYHRGLASEDPSVALAAARGLLSEAFGRPTGSAEEEPSQMIQSCFARPLREDPGRFKLIVVLRDGRLMDAGSLAFNPEPPAEPRIEQEPGGPH